MAVLDHRDEYAALGFNVVPTESTTPILTTSQIIGIAVGGGLGLILILVVLLLTITCCCVKHRSGQPKKGGDLTNAGTSLDLKPVPYEGLKEQTVGLESEEKERDVDYER
ncbi:uncharacterized protein LOC135337098 [Halichondria panicea]|uniref:uncharacterized protein LOC135337098 n=1 Tax=Halichondria panicea TaxID=6063 RepID=UPI00312BC2EB